LKTISNFLTVNSLCSLPLRYNLLFEDELSEEVNRVGCATADEC
jgi:hypothetical protein